MSGVGFVIIGRNEGARLIRCLQSVPAGAGPVVYVDSGSTDGSIEAARALGAETVALDMSVPFTAARARNAGVSRLQEMAAEMPACIQFIDGDCTLDPGWVSAATAFLDSNPRAAIACGRLRETDPGFSIYNRLADGEWDTPVGQAKACGGIMMIREQAFRDSGGFNPALIAGEEPELCLRLRQLGWQIWRLDAEMARHDIHMERFSQWWRRTRRAGHTYAEGAAMHGAPPERHKVRETRKALLWGLGLPVATVAGVILTPWALLLLLIWPAQVLRLRLRGKTWLVALFLTLAKFPEAQGVLGYYLRRKTARRQGLIEYK